MQVLITDATSRHMLVIARSLGKKSINIGAASYQKGALVFKSKYCRKKLISPRSSEHDAYVKFLQETSANEKPELIIAGSDNTSQYVSDNRETFGPQFRNALPSKEAFVTANQKDSCLKLAMDLGVQVPKSFFPDNVEEANKLADKLSYPVLVKGQLGSGSSNIRYVHNKETLIPAYREIYELEKEFDVNPPTIQEHLTGKGYICGMLVKNGEIIAHFQHRRFREYPITGGVSAIVESCYIPQIFEDSKKMIEGLNWHGIIMTEFKHNPVNDTYNLLEINPRFWGATGLAVAAGIDFPYMYYQLSMGEKVEPVTEYNIGLKYIFLFPTALMSVVSYPKSIGGLVKPLLGANSKTDIDWLDIKPTLSQLKVTQYLIRKGVKKTQTELITA